MNTVLCHQFGLENSKVSIYEEGLRRLRKLTVKTTRSDETAKRLVMDIKRMEIMERLLNQHDCPVSDEWIFQEDSYDWWLCISGEYIGPIFYCPYCGEKL